MSIVPPASATLVWAFPTPFEVVRCFVWEHSPVGWSIAIMFGDETLALETAPTRWAMEEGVDLVWRGLLSSGIGKIGRGSEVLEAMSGATTRAAADSIGSPTGARAARAAARSAAGGVLPRRFEDPFSPHTPFRHREQSFEIDIDPSDPSQRRRTH